MNIIEKFCFRIKMRQNLKPYYNDRKAYHVTWIDGKTKSHGFYSNSLFKIKLIGWVISKKNRGKYICTYIWKNTAVNDRCVQRWDIKGCFDNKLGTYMEGYIYDKNKKKFKLYYGMGS